MGRAAVHSGNIVTLDEIMKSEFQWCPGQDEMDYDTAPPVVADADGRYPAPSTGDWVEV